MTTNQPDPSDQPDSSDPYLCTHPAEWRSTSDDRQTQTCMVCGVHFHLVEPDPSLSFSDDPAEAIQQMAYIREVGSMQSLMQEQPEYVLIAYRVYPNGSTSPDLEQDPIMTAAIATKMGLPTSPDPLGWAIWPTGPVGK